MRWITMVSITFGMFLCGAVSAETFTCTAATNRAKVGVNPGNSVGITSDSINKECRFSVNGAQVGSPPPEDIRFALNSMIQGDMSRQLNQGDVTPLANLLLASARDTAPSPKLLTLLKNNASRLAACVSQFTKQPRPGFGGDSSLFRQNDLICNAVAEGTVSLGGNRIEVAARFPVYVIAVMPVDGVAHFLFYPPGFRQGKAILPLQ